MRQLIIAYAIWRLTGLCVWFVYSRVFLRCSYCYGRLVYQRIKSPHLLFRCNHCGRIEEL